MSDMALFLVSFLMFFLLGMPIAAAMIVSSFLYALSSGMGLAIMGTKMFTGLNNFALVAIPLFILTAEVMNRTSVADRIFKFCRDLVGYIPGVERIRLALEEGRQEAYRQMYGSEQCGG